MYLSSRVSAIVTIFPDQTDSQIRECKKCYACLWWIVIGLGGRGNSSISGYFGDLFSSSFFSYNEKKTKDAINKYLCNQVSAVCMCMHTNVCARTRAS